MRPLVTAAEMTAIEHSYVVAGGELTWLMRQAGMEVAARVPTGKRVLILAGPGNNGGDALVAASIIRERGDEVHLYTYKRQADLSSPASAGPIAGIDLGTFEPVAAEDDADFTRLTSDLEWSDLVLDGLLGTGRRRPVEGLLAEIIQRANQAHVQRIAIDLPTGVDADSGAVETVAFDTFLTVTLGFGKRGLWGSPGADTAGRIEIADIGLPPGSGWHSQCALLDDIDIKPLLPRRTKEWNKGKSGRVLVVSGSENYSGAPTLVSTAAYRSGAGLVELAVPSSVRPIVAGREVEAIFAPIPAESCLTPDCIDPVLESAKKAQVVALGPGLGAAGATRDFVRGLLPRLREANIPLVLDADGLNAVAGWNDWWEQVPASTVVTPHPGEMARLLDSSVSQVQSDRFAVATVAARRWNVVVVLKGSNTIIAVPPDLIPHENRSLGPSARLSRPLDHPAETPTLFVCPLGGPNLGTGGTGDVLTGIIAGYLAQGMPPAAAAIAGVWVHAAAGERLRAELGDAGTMASDLWPLIPRIQKELTS